MGQPWPHLSFISRSFQTNIITFLQQIYVKKVHPVYGAWIRTHDLQNMSTECFIRCACDWNIWSGFALMKTATLIFGTSDRVRTNLVSGRQMANFSTFQNPKWDTKLTILDVTVSMCLSWTYHHIVWVFAIKMFKISLLWKRVAYFGLKKSRKHECTNIKIMLTPKLRYPSFNHSDWLKFWLVQPIGMLKMSVAWLYSGNYFCRVRSRAAAPSKLYSKDPSFTETSFDWIACHRSGLTKPCVDRKLFNNCFTYLIKPRISHLMRPCLWPGANIINKF